MGLGSDDTKFKKHVADLAGSSKWKDKLTGVEDVFKLVTKLEAEVPRTFAGVMMDGAVKNRIIQLRAFLNHLKTERTGCTDVMCKDCGARLYHQDTACLTFHEFQGLPCPHKCVKVKL